MKRLIFPLIILSMLIFACQVPVLVTPTVNPPPPATQVPATQPSILTDTPIVPTVPPVIQTNTTCNEMAIYLDPALASNHTCETIPASLEGMEIEPQYTMFTLQGYPLSGEFLTPHIAILPVQDYSNLVPDVIPARVAELQGLIGGGAPTNKSLPLLPIFNAMQMIDAQYLLLPFGSGGGIRYLTLYAQYNAPINNHDLIYTYQGLTNDGKYWVSAILPINHPLLPANGDNPPNGQTADQFNNNYDPYINDMKTLLNSQAAASFTPSLTLLDALVSSITIQP